MNKILISGGSVDVIIALVTCQGALVGAKGKTVIVKVFSDS